MGVTIKDVAKEAGVSIMTVSRVVNKKEDISKETRDKVTEVIKRLKYKPNRLARSLAAKKSDFITLIVPDITNPYYSEMVKSVEDISRKNGYNIILGDTEGIEEIEKEYVDAALERMSDGIILVNPIMEDKLLSELNEMVPLVIIDRHVPNNEIIQVYVDNISGSMFAMEHLITQGHSRIGFLTGPKEVQNSRKRNEGYRKALKKHNITFDSDLVVTGDYTFRSGYTLFEYLMNIRPKITAIFASNDLMAIGLISRAGELGVHVPNDISIIGFDDILLSALINPPLTTILNPVSEMGNIAVALFLSQLNDEKYVQFIRELKTTLIVRDSTKVLNN